MKKQLEELLGCEIQINKIDREISSLPIFMAMRKIDLIKMSSQSFALVDVSEERDLTVSAMKKQHRKYEEVLQIPVAFKMNIDGTALRNALVKNGICFISLPGNCYLPFLGIVLQDIYVERIKKADKMMPATQMVFLELLYQDRDAGVMKSEIAKRLHLTKTSITRATAQLERMGLIAQEKSGTEVKVCRNYLPAEYFERAQKYLINPVQKTIEVRKEKLDFDLYLAGESALSIYSSLNPADYRICGL